MEQKKNLKIWFIVLAVLVAFLVVLLMLLLNINKTPGGETVPTQSEQLASQRTYTLKTGESVNLILDGLVNPTLTTSNPNVVSVAADGSVKALKAGNALITVTSGDYTYHCGILVDSVGEIVDVTKLQANILFSDIMLNSQREIEGMTIDPLENAFYFSQVYGASAYNPLASDIIVSKVVLGKGEDGNEAWVRGDYMRFYESGSGMITADVLNGKTALWLESNGSFQNAGSTISVVEWDDHGHDQENIGTTYELAGLKGFVNPVVDVENDLILAYDTGTKSYKLYVRTDLMEGEAAACLREIKCESHQTPAMGLDDSQGRYNASIRGYALGDGYIYQISGNTSIYITVFDLEGQLQYCYRLADYPDMETRMPAAIAYKDGKLYVTIASGNSTCYLANVWVYEEAKAE
jgi:hypothetical protein